MREEYVLQY